MTIQKPIELYSIIMTGAGRYEQKFISRYILAHYTEYISLYFVFGLNK